MEEQPGFAPAGAVQHVGEVKAVCYGGRGLFVSLTSTAIKTWSIAQQPHRAGPAPPHALAQLQLPHAGFVSAVVPCARTGLLFGACQAGAAVGVPLGQRVDGDAAAVQPEVRMEHLFITGRDCFSSFKVQSAPLCLNPKTTHFTFRTDEIISAGSGGVHCWASSPDDCAYAKSVSVPAAERPALTPSGLPVPWAYGRFERVWQRLAFALPGGGGGGGRAAGGRAPLSADASYSRIQLHPQEQLLLVLDRVSSPNCGLVALVCVPLTRLQGEFQLS
jgi:hypothetical protein